MNALVRIRALRQLLDRHTDVLVKAISQAGEATQPAAIALQRAFDFGRNTLESIALLLQERRDVAGSVMLCRSFYELAVRVLWATQHDYGWDRFATYYADEERRWAEQAQHLSPFKELAEHVLSIARPILQRSGPDGKPFKAMARKLVEVLRELDVSDLRRGFKNESDQGQFQYIALYRMMCRPAHGNVFPMLTSYGIGELAHVVEGVALAVLALIRSRCHVLAQDLEEERADLEREGRPIIEVLTGSQHLTLEDLDDEP